MHEYTCPECSAVLRSNSPAPEGKKIRCKKCSHAFIPVEAVAAKPVDDDNDVSAYGLTADPDANKPKPKIKFEHEDKDKRSARGPAMALLVLPTNLLIMQGALTFLGGVFLVVTGLFPLVFAEVTPSEEEYREQAGVIIVGFLQFLWGCLICFGASRAQNLESYIWAWVGAVAGLPAGIFLGVMLRNPKVIAGFQEMEGAMDDEEGGDKDDDDDDEEDEDED